MKRKKIVAVPVAVGIYEIKKITNLIEPTPGSRLTERELRRYLSSSFDLEILAPETPLAVAPVVRFAYAGADRVVEVYSIKQSSAGNMLLYGREITDAGQLKSFVVGDMYDVRLGAVSFVAVQ